MSARLDCAFHSKKKNRQINNVKVIAVGFTLYIEAFVYEVNMSADMRAKQPRNLGWACLFTYSRHIHSKLIL